jgi:hypothetical protein
MVKSNWINHRFFSLMPIYSALIYQKCGEDKKYMQSSQFRARGQSAFFAGSWLVFFLPFFYVVAMETSGYNTATQLTSTTKSAMPLLGWGTAHIVLISIYAVLRILPLALAIPLAFTLRRVVHGKDGSIGMWTGIAGFVVHIAMILISLALFIGTAEQYANAGAVTRAKLGNDLYYAVGTENLIANVLGGLLLAVWLWTINFPTARLAGYERVVGILGLLSSALFAATAALIAYDPRQSYQILTGGSWALLGIWLALIGILLIQRAPFLGDEVEEGSFPTAAS